MKRKSAELIFRVSRLSVLLPVLLGAFAMLEAKTKNFRGKVKLGYEYDTPDQRLLPAGPAVFDVCQEPGGCDIGLQLRNQISSVTGSPSGAYIVSGSHPFEKGEERLCLKGLS